MPDYELLELVLFAAIPRRDTKPLAKALIAAFGSFADVIAAVREHGADIGRAVVEAVTPDDLATIIHTSGSSGEPKGVMLTHANIVANLRDVPEVLTLGPEDTAVSFLPLSHAFERTTAYVYLTHGVSLVFAESIDTLARDLMAVRPTVMSGVPRVFEKLLDRIVEAGHAEHGIKRRVFDLAMAVARERGRTVPLSSASASAFAFAMISSRLIGARRLAPARSSRASPRT